MRRRKGVGSYRALAAKAGALGAAFAIAFTVVPAVDAEPDKATETESASAEETGLAPHDSLWTGVDPTGETSVVPGAEGAPDTASGEPAYTELGGAGLTSPTRNSSPTVDGELAPTLDGMLQQGGDQLTAREISIRPAGKSDEGDKLYRLDGYVVKLHNAETDEAQEVPYVSFLRGETDAELGVIESAEIDGRQADINEDVELFSFPRPGSGVFLPHPWPAEVNGDMITFNTKKIDLSEETHFSVTFTLEGDGEDETAWTLYEGEETAGDLKEKLGQAKPTPRAGDPVRGDRVRVVVQVGGDRLADSDSNNATQESGRASNVFRYSGEPGAVLQLYEPLYRGEFTNLQAGRSNTDRDRMRPIDEEWATCTSDVNGECTFDIPVSGPGTQPYYWVAMTKASPGFEVQEYIRAGGSGAWEEGSETLRYAFATPNMSTSGGKTFYSGAYYKNVGPKEDGWGSDYEYRNTGWEPSSFMWEVKSRADRVALEELEYRTPLGVFQQRRVNPPLPNRCGLRVGFIIDVSTSMGNGIGTMQAILNGREKTKKQEAVKGVLPELANTSTEIGLVTFASDTPGVTGRLTRNKPNILEPLKMNNESDRKTAQEWVDRLYATGDTNWEAGLKQFADYNRQNPGAKYDVVYMITDGNPTRNVTTRYPNPNPAFERKPQNGFDTEFRYVEAAMGVANTLKEQGTRVVPVGIPSNWPWGQNPDRELQISEHNLMAISGKNPDGSNASLRYSNFVTYKDSDVFRQALINTLNTCAITVERRFYEGDGEPTEGPTISNTRATTKEENNEWGYEGVLRPQGRNEERKTEYPDKFVAGPDRYEATFKLNGETPYDNVQIREQKKVPQGWQPMPTKDGKNAQCFDANKNPVTVNNLDQLGDQLGVPPTNDFQLDNVPAVGGIHCVVYYRKPTQPSGFDFLIKKVDAEDNTVSLDSAEFELRPLNDDGTIGEPKEKNQDGAAPNSSMLKWTNLDPGRFVLIETKAPQAQNGPAYSLLPQPIYFSVTADGGSYKVKLLENAQDKTGKELNDQNLTFPVVGFDLTAQQADQSQLLEFKVANVRVGNLPKTGGLGVAPWLLAALMLMALGGTLARKRA
ncbi:SpaA isopeptide-forming pilin-related protein [Corynebacterium cystitidis]|uniref:von Willebrand factor type A domain-containing protein n=1 Tax=Corynebacterium cystitidis DSM 20524 TaxID=1121357 RepID=A0A1H9V7S0_9CORY|nr:VWA domain-containing protein [Corynebacterium cystitidis]WJY83300.1 hypothetical protein CCYS_12055 [Corynebacterium cystitidis DSM 20524]SES17628.1 von Willebrand factor type A domain-containing protein [Corynebacterium cystitidis DSM 20524]SNV63658.1 putative surface-anchored fimbrial subunit [Corynebacterium cystitidis]